MEEKSVTSSLENYHYAYFADHKENKATMRDCNDRRTDCLFHMLLIALTVQHDIDVWGV